MIVDSHFEKLAPTHLETLFLKINVEKNPFLVDRLRIVLIPTIVLIRDGKTEHSILGFDEFGGIDEFSTDDLAYVLAGHGVLNFDSDRYYLVDILSAYLNFLIMMYADLTTLRGMQPEQE